MFPSCRTDQFVVAGLIKVSALAVLFALVEIAHVMRGINKHMPDTIANLAAGITATSTDFVVSASVHFRRMILILVPAYLSILCQKESAAS